MILICFILILMSLWENINGNLGPAGGFLFMGLLVGVLGAYLLDKGGGI